MSRLVTLSRAIELMTPVKVPYLDSVKHFKIIEMDMVAKKLTVATQQRSMELPMMSWAQSRRKEQIVYMMTRDQANRTPTTLFRAFLHTRFDL